MDNQMDHIINQLSRIEDTAVRIMQSADDQKKELETAMNRRTREFDEKLEQETARRLDEMKETLNARKEAELQKVKEETQAAFEDLDAKFYANRSIWVKQILNSLIGE